MYFFCIISKKPAKPITVYCDLICAVLEEVFRSLTWVKVPVQTCKNSPLQEKVLRSEPYSRKSTEALTTKCMYKCTFACVYFFFFTVPKSDQINRQ